MDRQVKVLCVAAARPNFMKVKPVLDALEADGAETVLMHTGQHFDAAMSDVFFSDIGLRSPDLNLGIASGSPIGQIARVMEASEEVMLAVQPDAVVVVGDVNATVACAMAAAHCGVAVVHVEAGLRSRDWSMPEEINRVVTDRISDLLLAPSSDAVDNLRGEGVIDQRIALVGNVMIDTLFANLARAKESSIVHDLGYEQGRYALVTLHRPSNVDDPEQLTSLLETLGEVAKTVPLVFPVHPRTRARLQGQYAQKGVTFIDPVGYLDFLALESMAAMVLTDSGGVQEETTALGVPCLTLRTTTERPITISEGTNQLVGLERSAILGGVDGILGHGVERCCPTLWDGHAGERSAKAILAMLATPDRKKPTDN